MTRALAYDEALVNRVGETLVLAVLYKPDSERSANAAQKLVESFRSLENFKIRGLPFRSIRLPFTDKSDLGAAIRSQGIDVLCLAPDLERTIPEILDITRRDKVLSTSLNADDTRRGVSLAIGTADGRPTIVVNLGASRLEGISFESGLLRIATVVR